MQQAYAQKDAMVRTYIRDELALANAGKIKQSEYWIGLYNLEQQAPVRAGDLIMAKGTNEMIEAARRLEAGQISAADYDAIRRNVQLEVAQEFQAAQDRFAEQQAQQQQANRAMLMQYYLNTRPVTTTCYGNTCTTR